MSEPVEVVRALYAAAVISDPDGRLLGVVRRADLPPAGESAAAVGAPTP